ncbi:hypothetical protein Ancab_018336, partial [Ancistrocladus abbreviatus]
FGRLYPKPRAQIKIRLSKTNVYFSRLKVSRIPHFIHTYIRDTTTQLPATMSSTAKTTTVAKSWFQSLRRYLKAPWEITGPCASPEYKSAVPKATEYRVFCPATVPQKAIIPTSNPETVYDIKYFSRDQRRNRPPIRRTVLKTADVEKMMKEKKTFELSDFPTPYVTATVIEDENARGGGYQK